MLLHYIKLSLRFIKKSFPQYMVGIMGVSFAVSCLVLSLYWVDFESSFDGFYPDADCIYRIYTYEKTLERQILEHQKRWRENCVENIQI